jgi:hypothetical protein
VFSIANIFLLSSDIAQIFSKEISSLKPVVVCSFCFCGDPSVEEVVSP